MIVIMNLARAGVVVNRVGFPVFIKFGIRWVENKIINYYKNF